MQPISVTVNSGDNQSGSNVPSVATSAFNLIAGNHVFVQVRAVDSSVTSITDTAGNTYVHAVGAGTLGWWHCFNCVGNASNVVTAHFSSQAFVSVTATQWEIQVDGLAFDSAATGVTHSIGSGNPVSCTPDSSQGYQLIFAAADLGAGGTPSFSPAGWGLLFNSFSSGCVARVEAIRYLDGTKTVSASFGNAGVPKNIVVAIYTWSNATAASRTDTPINYAHPLAANLAELLLLDRDPPIALLGEQVGRPRGSVFTGRGGPAPTFHPQDGNAGFNIAGAGGYPPYSYIDFSHNRTSRNLGQSAFTLIVKLRLGSSAGGGILTRSNGQANTGYAQGWGLGINDFVGDALPSVYVARANDLCRCELPDPSRLLFNFWQVLAVTFNGNATGAGNPFNWYVFAPRGRAIQDGIDYGPGVNYAAGSGSYIEDDSAFLCVGNQIFGYSTIINAGSTNMAIAWAAMVRAQLHPSLIGWWASEEWMPGRSPSPLYDRRQERRGWGFFTNLTFFDANAVATPGSLGAGGIGPLGITW